MKKKFVIIIVSIVVVVAVSVGVIAFNYPENKSEWTLQRLIDESDCCVRIDTSYDGFFCGNAIPSEPLKDVYEKDGKFYQEVIVTFAGEKREIFIEYNKKDVFDAPSYEITIIQEGEKFLNEHQYILFLTKAEEDDCYYVLGGKDGAIELDDFKFKPLNKGLNRELRSFFKDYDGFCDWLIEDYEFSENMYKKKQVTHSSIETTAAP